jgi:hypothetical protein
MGERSAEAEPDYESGLETRKGDIEKSDVVDLN